jgi:hypothetical protein
MRLDVTVPHPANLTARVFLDGVEVVGCTVADEEQGYIEKYTYPLKLIANDAVATERHEGTVVIIVPEGR